MNTLGIVQQGFLRTWHIVGDLHRSGSSEMEHGRWHIYNWCRVCLAWDVLDVFNRDSLTAHSRRYIHTRNQPSPQSSPNHDGIQSAWVAFCDSWNPQLPSASGRAFLFPMSTALP